MIEGEVRQATAEEMAASEKWLRIGNERIRLAEQMIREIIYRENERGLKYQNSEVRDVLLTLYCEAQTDREDQCGCCS